MGGAQDYLAHRTVIDEAEARISRMILSDLFKDAAIAGRFIKSGAKAAFGPERYGKKTLAESWFANQPA